MTEVTAFPPTSTPPDFLAYRCQVSPCWPSQQQNAPNMMGAVANSNAAVGSKVLRLIGGGSVEPLRMAAGFVQCRLLSLRAWHVQHQQRRRSVTSTALGAQLGAQEALDGEAAAAAAAPLLRPHQAAAQGSIELFVGPMFAGKTSALLQRVAQYESAGLRVAVVKSNKDNRYDAAHVVTHDGCRKPCFAVPTLAAFREAAGAAYEGFQVGGLGGATR